MKHSLRTHNSILHQLQCQQTVLWWSIIISSPPGSGRTWMELFPSFKLLLKVLPGWMDGLEEQQQDVALYFNKSFNIFIN